MLAMNSSPSADSDLPARPSTRSGKVVVVMFAVAAVAAVAYFVVAMPGMDMSTDKAPTGSSPGMSGMDMANVSSRLLSPAEFARALKADAFVVNVHTPYASEIAKTDAIIPFDAIAGDARVPRNREAKILLYCRSGRMSAIAAQALLDAGYMRVAELRGGMDAWVAAGRTLTTHAR